ncbi:hypothetical protein CC77DRAFT_643204 [Alternaria alternata]|uniref:Uncharacterized protein n=1 Tax=Alternaria alternata TaxID=5599 RepID=A0A177DYG3_ALTAL|nr:hypothetical protein CC77DRAFT_643204 [Alternaria alternata]OAG24022.1 hypothetical protein CC77DRAFT_643204 [Alternaria alternata]
MGRRSRCNTLECYDCLCIFYCFPLYSVFFKLMVKHSLLHHQVSYFHNVITNLRTSIILNE